VPHVVTTSYLTHDPIEQHLALTRGYGYSEGLYLSRGQSVGLRMIPMERDLRFAWEETSQQLLDVQAQKVRESVHAALLNWAKQAGEGTDYIDNLPLQCLHPVGHWFEIPNLLLNGILERMLEERPRLKHLMIHNVDTMGANLDPALLGAHMAAGVAMTVEVMSRRIDDRGGGLAVVNGHLQLVEGMALPYERIEFDLSYYNTNTFWIDIDKLLAIFGLDRASLSRHDRVVQSVRATAARMPTYVALKEVKKRWGKGQEDVYPVAQFEKLWVDMTALAEVDTQYVVVARYRGQQLKEPAQLDGWLRDGSGTSVASLCAFESTCS
jgi:hypothetical protein